MIAKVKSCGLMGIDGFIVDVEVDISSGLPSFDIVGLPDAAVRESKERVRAAIKNCNLEFPVKKITINLAPAHIKKEGPSFDLPISIAILTASEQIKIDDIDQYLFLGELSLNGELRPINGTLPIAMTAYQNGIKKIILPCQNAYEAAVVKGLEVYPASNLYDIVSHLTGEKTLDTSTVDIDSLFAINNKYNVDFCDVKGQENVKRALEVAAAGGHNCLMIGPPGSGKTMIAQRMPTILPDMSFEESLEVTKIHSIAGLIPQNTSLITTRPFRNPHHTISFASLVGGGKIPKPGEISLAHFGVLFLDELPEFKKDVLEVMRQPLEDGQVTISRVNATLTYPCSSMLIASMNPCKCGFYGDPTRECTCTPFQIQQYLSKISGPLLDRIDIHVEVAPVKYTNLASSQQPETSNMIKKRVDKARKIQLERYKNHKIFSNSQLTPSLINEFCKLGDKEQKMLKLAFDRLRLSARAHSRILKVARTIADLDNSNNIQSHHLAEAIQYRSLDRKLWK
jgi:magnesium chelatase family protein